MKKLLILLVLLLPAYKGWSQANTLPANGPVGIGTTTPLSTLHVVGTGVLPNANNNTSAFSLFSNTTAGLEIGASIRLGGLSGNTVDPYTFGVIQGAKASTTANDYSGTLKFFTTGSTGGVQEWMRILANGNVGVGTTAPAYKLDAVGNGFYLGSHANNTTSTTLNIGAGSAANSLINFGFYSTFDATIWQIGRWGTDQSFRVSNFSSGSEVNVITATGGGNVGIGITTPESKFTVSSPNASLRIGYNNTGENYYDANVQHVFRDNSGNMKFRILTNSPTTISLNNFLVNSSTGGQILTLQHTNTASEWNYVALVGSNGSRTHYYGSDPSKNFVIGSDDATKSMKITGFSNVTTESKVGIGTTAPSNKLEIAGATGSGLRLTGIKPADGITKALAINADGDVVVGGTTTNIWQDATDKISLTAYTVTKKVIIGDANTLNTPGSYKLYVEGGILSEEVKVAVRNTANWSDYVFAPSYKLMPLSEVEQFTKVNKHLPNVPSAEEVVNTGINVAKMDAKLLEKIEELTLYLIEMNKKNESLQKQNDTLLKRLEALEAKLK